MIHILLLLLKIIGWLLLILLLLVFAVLAIVLLVPVRYEANGTKRDTLTANVRISWLLKICRFSLDFNKTLDNPLHIQLKIFSWSLFDNLKPKIKRVKSKKNKQDETPKNNESSYEQTEYAESIDQTIEEREYTPILSSQDEDDKYEDTDTDKKKRRVPGIKNILIKIKSFFGSFSEKLEGIRQKLTILITKKEHIQDIYLDEANHIWFQKFFKRLRRLIYRILPRVKKLDFHFGFHDPGTTGQVLGILSMMYPFFGEAMELQPEFEQEILEGSIAINGKIRLIHFVVFAIQSFLNRRFFTIVKQVKHI